MHKDNSNNNDNSDRNNEIFAHRDKKLLTWLNFFSVYVYKLNI